MQSVLMYFEQSVEKYSDRIAAKDEYGKCTYTEPLENSKRIESTLADEIKPKPLVAFFYGRRH